MGGTDISVCSRTDRNVGATHQRILDKALAALRRSMARGAPFGGEAWQHQTAEFLGLPSSYVFWEDPIMQMGSQRTTQPGLCYFPFCPGNGHSF